MPTKIPEGLRKKKQQPTNNSRPVFNNTTSLMRSQFLTKMFDPRRDIDDECGYPKEISAEQYRTLYDREGIAERVVSIFPVECWSQDPMLRENEDAEMTEFEERFIELQKDMNLWHYLARADEMSGIGSYGVLLLGINDGKPLDQPVDGINERGERVGAPQHELLYLRVFDESLVNVDSFENDETNPRFGQPVHYMVEFADPRNDETDSLAMETGTDMRVHWSRVIHLADNRKSSEIFGVPRMRPVYNRLYDLRKLLGGSAEMFWKGAFPGYSFEVNPDMGDVELDASTLRSEFEAYSNGLQRYLALAGVSAKSLSPQVANPEAHINSQIKAIAITLGVPWRIFVGSEQAQLASSQDKATWLSRVAHRQNKYIGPLVIRPFIDRLVAFGILPECEEYFVEWPDLATPSDEDKAMVAVKVIEAMSKYVQSGVDTLVPPMEFFTIVMGMPSEQAEAILNSAEEQMLDMDMPMEDDEFVDEAVEQEDEELEEEEPEPQTELEEDELEEEE